MSLDWRYEYAILAQIQNSNPQKFAVDTQRPEMLIVFISSWVFVKHCVKYHNFT